MIINGKSDLYYQFEGKKINKNLSSFTQTVNLQLRMKSDDDAQDDDDDNDDNDGEQRIYNCKSIWFKMMRKR